jgi:hypothetical protein
VAGRHRVEAEGEPALEHGGELDLLVAAQARVGGAAGGVLGDEVLDDVGVELARRSPTRRTGCRACRRPGGRRGSPPASSSRATPTGTMLGVAVQRQVDAGDLVARQRRARAAATAESTPPS